MISEIQSINELIKKEGDQKEWIFTCKNGILFKCYIRRVPRAGHLCGYVHLTTDSDYYGYEYDDIPVVCHGGLTYASEHENEWVIGFDCAHYGDLQPFYTDMEIYGNTGTYRDMEFVKKECESICEQISTKSKSHYRTIKLNNIL
jgi:hypothetical protein